MERARSDPQGARVRLTGAEANHGEDIKEYWWYLDAIPSHAWNLWRYHYPQAAFPYAELSIQNGRRGRLEPEYELLDTGVFDDDRYWITEVCYAKADPTDLLMAIRVTNAGPRADTLHVLPTAWFRNTWSSDPGAPKPLIHAAAGAPVTVAHPFLGALELLAGAGPDGAAPTALFCENETNSRRLLRAAPGPPYPKDGINDHVVSGAATVNPSQRGTKCAFWHRLTVAPGATAELRVRLRPRGVGEPPAAALGAGFDRVVTRRRAEADEFYAELTPRGASADEAMVMRQAFAGLLWSKQFYNYDVSRWLDGDPAQAVPPAARRNGRNARWRHKVFDKLLVNFGRWANLEDAGGNNLLEGGFPGLDHIGPLGRSPWPAGGILEQSDATGWIAFFAITMAGIAAVLHRSGRRPAIDLVLEYLEHFAAISGAIDVQGIWDNTDGLYYDRILAAGGTAVPVQVRSMAGIVAALAVAVVDERTLGRSLLAGPEFADFLDRHGLADREKLGALGLLRGEPGHQRLLLSVAGRERLEKLFTKLFDEGELLSPYGLRARSAYHRDHPCRLDVNAAPATIDHEPAGPPTAMSGRNSNWRGPLWFPLNYLVISALERYHRFFGDELEFEYPTGSGRRLALDAIARDLRDRLISIFAVGPDGRRPCFGWVDRLQRDPAWKDNLVFNEYFHGDNAADLGASHQTGWTGVIADVIRRRHCDVHGAADVLAGTGRESQV